MRGGEEMRGKEKKGRWSRKVAAPDKRQVRVEAKKKIHSSTTKGGGEGGLSPQRRRVDLGTRRGDFIVNRRKEAGTCHERGGGVRSFGRGEGRNTGVHLLARRKEYHRIWVQSGMGRKAALIT